MSTRSILARLQPDGKRYDTRYCHSDGYPAGVGATLARHYTDPEKVEQLFALGDISVLGSELGEKHDFNWRMKVDIPDWAADPRSEWTKVYHRDRDEPLNLSTCAKNRLRSYADGMNGEYVYVWRPEYQDWVGYDVQSNRLAPVDLTQYVSPATEKSDATSTK